MRGSLIRLSSGHFLTGALLAIWCAALSGWLLTSAPQALLPVHLISSLGGLAPLAGYLGQHWWLRREKIARHSNTPHGYIALACLSILMLSGLALLYWTNVAPLRWLHDGALIVLLFELCFHVTWRIRQQRQLTLIRPRWRASGKRRAGVVGMLAVLGIVLLPDTLRTPASVSGQASQTISVTHASLGANTLFAAADCAACHGAITQQWQVSGHAHAATDAYYQAVATLFIEENGPNAVQFCAACHNPIGLVQGEVDISAAARVKTAAGAAYQARKLGITLPISARAAEGVTCALCHQAAQAAATPANSSLRLATNLPALPTDALAQLTLRAAPDSHKEMLLRPVIQQADLCGSCHNLRLPNNGLALEPTYDEWQASPYPARGVTCQNCHFPPVSGAKADSSSPATLGAHGTVPGALSSLPGMADDPSLLRKAAALDARLTRDSTDPARLMATVNITNTGAGHHLPTGASDLRQVWLELALSDSKGQVLWSSGVLDQYGGFDRTTVQFRKVLGDANGQPIDLHRVWIATQILSDTSLRPLEARAISYPIAVPSTPSVPLTLTVRLLYRDVSQAFAEFAQNGPAPDLPVREMARSEAMMSR